MTNSRLVQMAERRRLNMILRAQINGDTEAYERAVNSYVNSEGEIIFPETQAEVLTVEKLDAKISELEFELIREENMTFLPKDFYEKQNKLNALKKQRQNLINA